MLTSMISWQSRSTCLVFLCVCCMKGGSFHWSPYVYYSLLNVIIRHFHHSCVKVLRRSTYLPVTGSVKFCIASCLTCCIMLFYRSMRSRSVEVAAGWRQTSSNLSCGVRCVSDLSCTTKWSSVFFFFFQICRTLWNKLVKSTLRNSSTEMRMEVVYRSKRLGSSVGIATDYGLDGLESNPGRDEIFRPFRPAVGSTQPPIQWVPGLSRG